MLLTNVTDNLSNGNYTDVRNHFAELDGTAAARQAIDTVLELQAIGDENAIRNIRTLMKLLAE